MNLYSPILGKKREELLQFLEENGLFYDEGITDTVVFQEDGKIKATGSIQGNVLKCIAVSQSHRGEGLLADVVTQLHKILIEAGVFHYFLFTKPENKQMFSDMGFFPITETSDVLLMENTKQGIQNFVNKLKMPENTKDERIAAMVVNCNPFTKGHAYLMEVASDSCDLLHIFVLSEEKSYFSAETRYNMVKKGVENFPNIQVHQSSDYMISSATFPTYFLKDQAQAGEVNCKLDLQIFCEYFVPTLGINTRFVGTEPTCQVTASYNQCMKEILPTYGVEVIEIPRKEVDGQVISASYVRNIIENYPKELWEEKMKPFLPDSAWSYLWNNEMNG